MNRNLRKVLSRVSGSDDLSQLHVNLFDSATGKVKSAPIEAIITKVLSQQEQEQFEGELNPALIAFLESFAEVASNDQGLYDPTLVLGQPVPAIAVPVVINGVTYHDILLPRPANRYVLAIAVEATTPPLENVYAVGTTLRIRDIIPGTLTDGTPSYNPFFLNNEVDLDISNISGVFIDVQFAPNSLIPRRTYVSRASYTESSYVLEGGSNLHLEINLTSSSAIVGITEITPNNVNFLEYAAILAFNAAGRVVPVGPFTPIPPFPPLNPIPQN